jgi:uncharacterized protein (DUF302 family)
MSYLRIMASPTDPRHRNPPTRMMSVLVWWLACGAGLLGLGVACAGEQRYEQSSSKSYADAVEDLRFAVAEQNFRITSSNEIGSAIAARGFEDMPDSIVVHICNLNLARQLLERAPDRLLDMPCRLTIREDGDGVRIQARLVDETDERLVDLAPRINAILKDIVDFTARSPD